MTGGDKTIQRVKAKAASKGVICLTGSSQVSPFAYMI
jgi:hypothetical protein